MKSNLALEVPPRAVTPEAVVEKLQMNLDILRIEWEYRIENADYDELLKFKEQCLVPRQGSEEGWGKEESPSWQGEFASPESLLRMSELSGDERDLLEGPDKKISIQEPVSRLNDLLRDALLKKMNELRTTETEEGHKRPDSSPENPDSESVREPEIAPATEAHEEVLPSLDHVHAEGALRADAEKKLRFLKAKIEAAILNRYNDEIGAKNLSKLKKHGDRLLDKLVKNPDSEISAEEAESLDQKVRGLLEEVASEERKRKNAKRGTKEEAAIGTLPLAEKNGISEKSDSFSPIQDSHFLEPNQEQSEERRGEHAGGQVTEQSEEELGQAEAEGESQKKSSEEKTDTGLLDPALPIGKKTKGGSDKKIPAPKKPAPKKALKSALLAPAPIVKDIEEVLADEKSPMISENDVRETEEDLGAKMMDVSGVIDIYKLDPAKLRALEEDMNATAKAAAKETPYVIGSRRHNRGNESSFVQDTDRALSQETAGGEVAQKLSKADLPQEVTEKTPAEMPVVPPVRITEEKGGAELTETPGSREGGTDENDENAEKEEMPAVMHRRGDPSWRPLYSEEGKKEELKQALREVLAEIGGKAEALAEYEDKVLEAKQQWEEAVATRKYQENNFGGRLIGLFTSEASKKETLDNLRKEEENDKEHYENMEAHVVQLRRSFDLLKGRRDEIEHDLEEIANKESRPHNLESQAGRPPQDKDGIRPKEDNESMIYPSAREKFATMGLLPDHLSGIEGFADLSEGQQLLVFENLQQLTVGRIQEEAEKKTDQERQESGLWGRMWKSVSKRYQIAKAEKQTAAMMMRGGKSMHGEVLTQLVRGMREQGPEVKFGEDGKTLDIQFASGFDGASPESGAAREFNTVANAFARLPYEWSLETATASERKQYEKGESEFEASRKKLFDTLQGRPSGKVDSLFMMNDIDRQVQMMQFIQNNPKLEKQLEHFRDPRALENILASIVTERGIYMYAGYLGKTFLVGALGWAVAPAVSSVMGGLMARKRAKEELQKREKDARKGKRDGSKEAKNFVSAESLSQKLAHFMKRAGEEEGGEKAAHLLKTRIEYTRTKIEAGLVDFGGSPQDRVWHQYDLLQRISRAEAIVAIYASQKNERLEKRDEKVGERLESLLAALEEEISAKEKSYVRKQALKGAAIAAGFAGFGAALRWAPEFAAEHLAIPQGEVEPKDLMYEISPILYTTDEGASLSPSSSVTAEVSSDWDKVSPQDALEVPPPETTESGPLEEAPTEVSRSWDEAASEATLSPTDPRPEVALSQEGAGGEISEPSSETLPKGESGVNAEDIHGEDRGGGASPEAFSDSRKEEEAFVRQLMQEEQGDSLAKQDRIPSVEGASEVSRSWDEAASEATLSPTDPRPEVAFGQGLSANAIGVESSVESEGAGDEADEEGLERLVEKLSDEPEQELAADTSSLISAESMAAEKADISPESISQPAPKDTLSSGPPEELSPLSAFPEEVEKSDESLPVKEGSENTVAMPEKETVASELGDTKAFVREHPEMLEPLKKEIGSYRLNIFQTPETKGSLEYDYARSNLGKIEMGKALESYEYGGLSELHESQLQNLSEFRESTQKAFAAKLGEREGKGMAMVAAGETVNEYTRRMATIALQLKVEVKGF